MNWPLALARLWISVSVLWILVIGGVLGGTLIYGMTQGEGFEPLLWLSVIGWALVPPLLLFIALRVVVWIIHGFFE